MALINCPECGKEVSDTVKTCIHCGYNMNKTGIGEEAYSFNNIQHSNKTYALHSYSEVNMGYYAGITMLIIGSLLMIIAPFLNFYGIKFKMSGFEEFMSELPATRHTMFNVATYEQLNLQSVQNGDILKIAPWAIVALGAIGLLLSICEIIRGKGLLKDIPKLFIGVISIITAVYFDMTISDKIQGLNEAIDFFGDEIYSSTYNLNKDFGFFVLVAGIVFVLLSFIMCRVSSSKEKKNNINSANNSEYDNQMSYFGM